VSQRHLDRLSGVDASFLHQEKASSHMHIGALCVFQGPPPGYPDLLAHVGSRLHLVPRYRQRLAFPSSLGRPLWIDDPSFNLAYHARQTALPAPGSQEQLLNLTSRLFSQRLDRSKPLWELWLVEGLADNRFALISKTHHSLVDGIAGVDLITVLFDLDPVPPEADAEVEPWQPHREPTRAEVLATDCKAVVGMGLRVGERALGALSSPRRLLKGGLEAAEGVGQFAWGYVTPAPETPLHVEIGPHRRFVPVRLRLDDLRVIKHTLGGTVNDVVLAVVAGALRRWLRSRGQRVEGLQLRALVPVSVREAHQHKAGGNRLALVRGPLPVYVADPVTRLLVVRETMDGIKDSKQALGAKTIASAEEFAPPTILAQASRLNFSTRLFNLLVTNVPGPQFPLYVLGRALEELHPVAFLPEGHALAIAIMSYHGQVNFGLLGDYDALPDIDTIAEGIAISVDELLDAAHERGAEPVQV
jgi:WS/DGAT/MGAT family acyltransferase